MTSVYARYARRVGTGSALAAGLLITSALVSPAFAEIEIVTVTAEKRLENNIDVPISVTVNTANDIKNKNIGDLTELGQKMPNVNGSGTFIGTFNIRGIATASAGSGFPPDVGVNVDEVFMGRDRAFDSILADVSSVELLRGPQGTLYGKNTIAGVINITTVRPTEEFEAKGDARFGNLGYAQLRGTVSGGILDDKVLVRVTGAYEVRDGFLKDTFLGKDLNNLNQGGGRIMVVTHPFDNFTLEIRADAFRQADSAGTPETQHTLDAATCTSFPYNFLGCNAAFYSAVPVQNPTDRIIQANLPSGGRRGMWGTSAKAEYVWDNYTFTSITAYRSLTSTQSLDNDASQLDGFDTGTNEAFRRFSQELRVTSPEGDRFSWIAGAYFDSELDHEVLHIHVGRAFPSFLLGAPFPKLLPAGFSESAQSNALIQDDSSSVFFSAKYDITDQLKVSGGLRYTADHKSLNFAQAPTSPIAVGVIFAFAEVVPQTFSTTNASALSGDATVSYAFAPDKVAYFRFAHGFKAGGFQSDIISPPYNVAKSGLSFKPEFLNDYEIGFKSVWFDNQFAANFAAFHYDFTNKQEQVNTGVSFVVSNAASATSDGLEVELNWSPTMIEGFNAFANFGLLDAHYDSFPNGGGVGINFDGKQLAGASRYSASWGATYTTPITAWAGKNFYISTDWDYRARQFTDPANNASIEVQPYMIINARIGVEDGEGKWGVYLWGRNLGDKTVLGGGVDVLNNIYISRNINVGRTYGIELRGQL